MEAILKAENLVAEFYPHCSDVMTTENGLTYSDENQKWYAKQCAIILVKERLKELETTHIGYGKLVMQGYQKYKKDT